MRAANRRPRVPWRHSSGPRQPCPLIQDVLLAPARHPVAQPPAELAAVPVAEQWHDIVCVAALANVPPKTWPSPPSEIPAVARNLWRPWIAVPDSAAFRVSDLLRRVGCTESQNYLLVSGDRHAAARRGANRGRVPPGRLDVDRVARRLPQVDGALLPPRRVAAARPPARGSHHRPAAGGAQHPLRLTFPLFFMHQHQKKTWQQKKCKTS